MFTHSILQAIHNTGSKSQLRVSEPRTFVSSRVRELTRGQQTPNARRVNLEFDYPIYAEQPLKAEGPVSYIPGWKDMI